MATTVRIFHSDRRDGVGMGESRIEISPGVRVEEGLPFSAYSAHFGAGETAQLPASYEEVWVVVSGQLRIRSDGLEVVAGAGDYVYVPRDSPGVVDAMEATTLVCVSVPAH
ncbi:DUF861 domain-containing protein [Ruania alkalisoli]|uniref:DUF861 domain-containing protein n=1 Tax=Ruania alkalisoli TaxID=2779775 RepID=A0A7M1SRT7_9MICO|nr:cupin domain-containing protein [Ruania alkalisoli]QOR69857.1 DUF861 domain-containing protein [Ruania alkalisoli]